MSDLVPPMMPEDLDALIQAMGRVQALEAEVARLRLTDAEREVLATVRDIYASHGDDDSCSRIAAVIDGLLERMK
jgi:hypothetical protein